MEHPAVAALARELAGLGWVSELWVGGSLATGDHHPAVSDLDLVALTNGPVTSARETVLVALHRRLDDGAAAGARLGCVHVDAGRVDVVDARHPTWTHGSLTHRPLSGISRAELVRHGYAVLGREPGAVLPAMSDDDVRAAARDEVCGYWARAVRRPHWWVLEPVLVDLGLTGMARGRHALATGRLLTKTDAIEHAHAPAWLVDQVRARRRGEAVTSPRLCSAAIAWRDARRTVRAAQKWVQPAGPS